MVQGMGRGTDKAPVIALISLNGEARAFSTENAGSGEIYKIVTENIERGSTLMTDVFSSYKWVSKQYDHAIIKHSMHNGRLIMLHKGTGIPIA